MGSKENRDPSVLLVSKPLVPPWSDSGKNLARDVATYCTRYRFHVMGTAVHSLGLSHVIEDPIYTAKGAYRPSRLQNLRVLWRLVRPNRERIYHFFFAPNRLSGTLGRVSSRIKRRVAIHTVLSVPATFERVDRMLAGRVVVAVSEFTAGRLREAGISEVHVIRPGSPIGEPVGEARIQSVRAELGLGGGRPVVLYPGDYEFSDGAETFAAALPRLLDATNALAVFACRLKTPAAEQAEAHLRERLAEPAASGRVVFLNHVDDMHALLASAAVVTLPASNTYAKMDLPLVLLEAMAEGVPLVLARSGPLPEILVAGGGELVPAADPAALADRLIGLVRDEPRRAQLGAQASQSARANFDARAMGEAYADLYDAILEAGSRK